MQGSGFDSRAGDTPWAFVFAVSLEVNALLAKRPGYEPSQARCWNWQLWRLGTHSSSARLPRASQTRRPNKGILGSSNLIHSARLSVEIHFTPSPPPTTPAHSRWKLSLRAQLQIFMGTKAPCFSPEVAIGIEMVRGPGLCKKAAKAPNLLLGLALANLHLPRF